MTAVDPIMQSQAHSLKTLCIHHSTVWPVSYITRSVESLTRIRFRWAPLPLFIISGTLGRLHKSYICCRSSVFYLRWFLVSDATQWTLLHMAFRTCAAVSHVRFKSRVTFRCQEYLLQTPVGLTSENLPGGLRPKVCSDTDLITSHQQAITVFSPNIYIIFKWTPEMVFKTQKKNQEKI